MAELINLPFELWTRMGQKKAQVQSYSPGGANVPSHVGTLAPPGEYDWTVHLWWAVMRSYVKLLRPLVMVALCNRADHYIFAL